MGIGDTGGGRQSQQGPGQRRPCGQLAATRMVGHRQRTQAVNDRLVAQHGAGHRCCQRRARGQLRTAGVIGDHGGIGSAFVARAAGHHAGVTGRFLVAAHRGPAHPAQRVEPVDREQRLDQHIGKDVLAAMVREFVGNREVALLAVGGGHEARRKGDDLVEHPEGHRPRNRWRFDQADGAHLTHRPCVGEQFAAQHPVEPEPARHEDDGADQPHRDQRRHEIDRRSHLHGRLGSDDPGIGKTTVCRRHQRHVRALHHTVRRAGVRGSHRLHPRGQRHGREQQPRHRQTPQRIGCARAEMAGDWPAQHEGQRDQRAGPDQRIEQEQVPAFADQPDHLRISFRSASISARSSSLSASLSASCANRGAARPPNRRSTSRRLSPPTYWARAISGR